MAPMTHVRAPHTCSWKGAEDGNMISFQLECKAHTVMVAHVVLQSSSSSFSKVTHSMQTDTALPLHLKQRLSLQKGHGISWSPLNEWQCCGKENGLWVGCWFWQAKHLQGWVAAHILLIESGELAILALSSYILLKQWYSAYRILRPSPCDKIAQNGVLWLFPNSILLL